MLVVIKQLIDLLAGGPVASAHGPGRPPYPEGMRMPAGPHYKWIALSNTTLGVLMATINASIMLIALPDIFRGIGVNPLDPGNTGLLLWLIMGYLVVTAVLVVSLGRLGDMFGVGGGMSATFQNSAMVLSIGIFFTLIILGLASSLPATLSHGLAAQGVPPADAARVAALPPVSILFAALLGYNPVQTLLGSVVDRLPASHAAYLTGHTFFPSLIAAPFASGLAIAFDFAIVACLVAAVASLLRGGKYVHGAEPGPAGPQPQAAGTARVRAGIPATAGARGGFRAAAGEIRPGSPTRVPESTVNGASSERL
jgi:hypothetical protein